MDIVRKVDTAKAMSGRRRAKRGRRRGRRKKTMV